MAGIKTNKFGIVWGKGEEFGTMEKWVAMCEDHGTVVSDTAGSRIRTMSPEDFCDCHRGMCVVNMFGHACPNCGAVEVSK